MLDEAKAVKAMREAHTEITQFHHTAYPDCRPDGVTPKQDLCPAHSALYHLDEALKDAPPQPGDRLYGVPAPPGVRTVIGRVLASVGEGQSGRIWHVEASGGPDLVVRKAKDALIGGWEPV